MLHVSALISIPFEQLTAGTYDPRKTSTTETTSSSGED